MSILVPSPTARSRSTESGAVAAVAAVTVALLFSVAALAVDLGNGWSRKREVARQADLAALAGGAELPAKTQADKDRVAAAVFAYMQENWVPEGGQAGGNLEGVSPASLISDSDFGNGQIEFLNPTFTKMRVTAPLTTVNFALAGIMGFESLDVQASTTVEISTPGTVSPAYLVDGNCTTGSTLIDLGANGNNGNTSAWTPNDNDIDDDSPYITLDSIGPSTVIYNTPTTLAIQGTGWNQHVNPTPADVDVVFAHTSGALVSVDPTSVNTSGTTSTASVSVPPTVYGVPGVWNVYIAAKVPKNSSFEWAFSSTPLPVTVNGGSIPECENPFESNRLQLMSPRLGFSSPQQNAQTQLALNWATGLDHGLLPFPDPSALDVYGSCGPQNSPNGSPYQLDSVSQDGNNCVNPNGGNDGSAIFKGLISGGTLDPETGETPAGRLDRATSPMCASNGTVAMSGHNLNNDTLACFLTTGTINDIAVPRDQALPEEFHGVLSSEIFSSPRFLWVPIVKPFADQNGGGNADYRAVVDFAPAFLTSEGHADAGTCTSTKCAGLETNGNSVKTIRIFAFHPDALPETAPSGGGSIPYIGTGTKVVTLVDNDL